MTRLAPRPWVPEACEAYVQSLATRTSDMRTAAVADWIDNLTAENAEIHDRDCVNLNPATNVMNPRAEALLSRGLGTRPSLGYPGEKYEMGLEAIEQIEVVAAELAAEVFDARYAEVRVASGALANLYAFMATCRPGDRIIVPPAEIGGHVTHHQPGAAGLYGLEVHQAPARADYYSVDLDGLRAQAHELRPRLITIGGSLNLEPHPVAEIRAIADEVGACVLFDAAHLCGMIAGRVWDNPLAGGAHLMTMSTYKSLGGPAGGLIVSNELSLAERLDKIAFPGLTANFDAGRVAALAMSLLDWRDHGQDYAAEMVATAQALAEALRAQQVPVYSPVDSPTRSHQFAILAEPFGGGQTAAKKLRRARLLACGIGLPVPAPAHDLAGLRIGTPEIVRLGMGPRDMGRLAEFIARALNGDPETVAEEVTAFRQGYTGLRFVNQ